MTPIERSRRAERLPELVAAGKLARRAARVELHALLDDRSPIVRWEAAISLADVDGSRARRALQRRFAREPSWVVRTDIVEAFHEIATRSDRAWLLGIVDGRDSIIVRGAAAWCLGRSAVGVSPAALLARARRTRSQRLRVDLAAASYALDPTDAAFALIVSGLVRAPDTISAVASLNSLRGLSFSAAQKRAIRESLRAHWKNDGVRASAVAVFSGRGW